MTDVVTKMTSKQERFLEALVSVEAKGDVRTAMDLAGYSKTTKTAYLARELSTQIREATEMLLALYAPKAAMALTSMLEKDAEFDLNTRHVLAAAKEVLDRTGFGVRQKIDVEVVQASMFILPPKDVN
jgi:hypothetical protein